ncbi:hypothetical protein, partial [Leptospira jelokensis]
RFVPELKELLTLGGSKTVGFGDFLYSPTKSICRLTDFVYQPLTIQERGRFRDKKLINQYNEADILKYNKSYRSAILHNDYYWMNFYQKERMRNEIEYNQRAFSLYTHISPQKWYDADSISHELRMNKREITFILRKWMEYGIADIIERNERYRKVVKFKIKKVKLYYLIYSNFSEVKDDGKV